MTLLNSIIAISKQINRFLFGELHTSKRVFLGHKCCMSLVHAMPREAHTNCYRWRCFRIINSQFTFLGSRGGQRSGNLEKIQSSPQSKLRMFCGGERNFTSEGLRSRFWRLGKSFRFTWRHLECGAEGGNSSGADLLKKKTYWCV